MGRRRGEARRRMAIESIPLATAAIAAALGVTVPGPLIPPSLRMPFPPGRDSLRRHTVSAVGIRESGSIARGTGAIEPSRFIAHAPAMKMCLREEMR